MGRLPLCVLAVSCLGLPPSPARGADAVTGTNRPPGSIRTAIFHGLELPYEVIDGLAVHGGDMILGPAEDFESRSSSKPRATGTNPAWPLRRDVAPAGRDHLWPDATVPYTIDTEVGAEQRSDILEAIGQWNEETVITLVARTDQPSYVRFYAATSGPCRAWVGMRGGEQGILLSPDGCSVGVVVHEIGHAVGLFHEHQRVDREKHLFLVDDNLDERRYGIYADIHPGIGPYDYASTMHYPLRAGSGNGLTAAETIPPGIRVPSSGLSAGDIDGVARLYGMAPTATTIATNPPGLEVVVDGVSTTTPAAFHWVKGSNHTLEVPSPQFSDGSRCLFGRWNDGGGRVRTVTADPDATWLEVNFIVQNRVTTSVEPAGSGIVTVSPSSPDGYYTLRTPLIVSASADSASGRRFMKWAGRLLGTHGAASNPARSKADLPGMEFKAVFTDQPFFRIDSTGDPVVIQVDGEEHYAPTALSIDGSRSSIQLSVEELQRARGRGALRYRFKEWSDGGELSRELSLPRGGGSVTARVDPEYPLYRYAPRRDSGTIDADPAGDDGYHREGTVVNLYANPNPGWEFVGWIGDVPARSLRVAIEMNRARRVDAVFSQTRKLEVGVPQAVELRSTAYSIYAHDRSSGFRVEPPPNARELTIRFDASTPDVDVDLLVDADSESLRWSYAEDGTTPLFEADFQSLSPGSSESVVITRDSEHGLGSALAYYISLVVHTPRTRIDGMLLASVRSDSQSSPVPVASPRALTFVSPVDSDPAAQTVRLSNNGLGSLHYTVESGSPWLVANPSTGTLVPGGSTDIAVSVASAGVAPDTHWGNLVIRRSDLAQDDASGRVEIPVAFAAVPAN